MSEGGGLIVCPFLSGHVSFQLPYQSAHSVIAAPGRWPALAGAPPSLDFYGLFCLFITSFFQPLLHIN